MINKYFNGIGLRNINITKVSKRLFKGHNCNFHIYYVYDQNQPVYVTDSFKKKFPRLINYNNRLFVLSDGFMAMERSH